MGSKNRSRGILITGASSGIGKALAQAYAKPGIYLALTGRNEERLAGIAKLCRLKGADVNTAAIDVCDRAALVQWIKQCEQVAPLDLVIANAGISNAGAQLTWEGNEQIFAVNVQGVLNTIHAVLPMMHARRQGHIAVMSSLAAYRGIPRSPAYCAAKAAIKVYGEALSGQLQTSGITVSVICPGFIKTPLTDKNPYKMPFLMDADKAATLIVKQLAKRKLIIAFPKMMQAVVWLLSVMPAALASRITRHL